MPVKPGQIYRWCDSRETDISRVRIDVVDDPNFARVTYLDSGRCGEVLLTALHDSPTTRTGQPRRTGYALEGPAAARFVTSMQDRDPQELERQRHEAWCREETCPTCDGTGGDHQIGCQS